MFLCRPIDKELKGNRAMKTLLTIRWEKNENVQKNKTIFSKNLKKGRVKSERENLQGENVGNRVRSNGNFLPKTFSYLCSKQIQEWLCCR
jgi:hypothetical protein